MFVRAELRLDLPAAVTASRLLDLVHRGELDGTASAAIEDGAETLARVGTAGLSKQVRVHVLAPYSRAGRTVVPIRWVATGQSGVLFPALDANVEVTGTDERSHVVLVGVYDPPLGHLGEQLDRLVLHRVAEATFHAVLQRLSSALLAGGADAGPEATSWRGWPPPEPA